MIATLLLAAVLGQVPPEFDLDLAGTRCALLAAPPEGQGPGVTLLLPDREGRMVPLEVWSAPILSAGLAERYPQITTYIARGLDDRACLARLDLSHNGLHAMILHGATGELVSAVPGRPDRVRVTLVGQDQPFWECTALGLPADLPAYDQRGPSTLRTYRAAFACTGEFAVDAAAAQGRAANLADALAAVVTIVNRTNLVLERDVAVRLELVATNDTILFLDPGSDPYSATDSGANLSANITTCGTRIGNTNFDLGHVLTRIPGGVAYLNAPCGTNKAGGVSGLPRTLTGDPFDPQVCMHEVGHQLGANHSFNGNVDRCLSNRNASTAWEPGSGTTILSYAGGCPVGNVPPGDNIVISRDIMYHAGNLAEMRAFLAGAGGSCGTATPLANLPPSLTRLPPLTGLAIPRQTPFALSAEVLDPGDSVTGSWEQVNTGPQQSLTGADSNDNGASPLFRAFAPTVSGTRMFPQLADIRAGAATPGERLPTVGGVTRRFRFVARDNHPGAGGVTISAIIPVLIAPDAGPFVITAPAEGATTTRACVVTWDVAGTNLAPVSATDVVIELSLDDGLTYALTLASATLNDGSQAVTLPAVTTSLARVRIRAVDGIFFAVSRPFTILPCDPDYDQNGAVDQDDVAFLINVIGGGGGPGALDPDFNIDGNSDQDDINDLIDTIAGGGCP